MVSGIVEDEDDAPCEALVRAFRVDDPSGPQPTKRSDDEGHFTLPLPKGRWALRAEGDDLVSLTDEVDVGQGREDHLRLDLAPAAWVGGRVLSPIGEPVVGARVDYVDYNRVQTSGLTDKAGFYRLRVSREEWDDEGRVRASATGFAPDLVWVCPNRDENPVPDFRLATEASIEGRVIDHEGRPIVGARVTAEGIGDMCEDLYAEPPSAVSGTDGCYRIVGLRSGDHILTAQAEGHGPGNEVTSSSGVRAPDLVLPRGGRIEGQVVRAEDGGPLATADVRLEYILKGLGDETWGGLDDQ